MRTTPLASFVWLAAALVSTTVGPFARGQSPATTAGKPNLARDGQGDGLQPPGWIPRDKRHRRQPGNGMGGHRCASVDQASVEATRHRRAHRRSRSSRHEQPGARRQDSLQRRQCRGGRRHRARRRRARGAIRTAVGKLAATGSVQRAGRPCRPGGIRGLCRRPRAAAPCSGPSRQEQW